MKSAKIWTALGVVCLLLSAQAALGQRVRLTSDATQGSVVTLAQASSSASGGGSADASGSSTNASSPGAVTPTPATTTPMPNPATTPPPTFNSTSPGTSSAAGMAAPLTYGNSGTPGYGSPGGVGSNPGNYGPSQPSMGSPGSYGGAAPAYSAPALAPSATLGGTITPAPAPWDPYAAGAAGPGQCPPAMGTAGGAPASCVPCVPVQVCPEFPWHVFGEFLYLEPRNTDVAFAIPITPGLIQNGTTGVDNPGYTPGFRIGFTRDLYDATSSLGASWTRLNTSANDSLGAVAPNGIHSLILAVPSPFYQSASGSYNIDYDLVDLDYRGLFLSSNRYTVNFLLGARYAHLTQDFGGTFNGLVSKDQVNTDITFTGGGIRVGLEGERFAARSGLMVYGRTAASFIAGKFDSHYTETGTQGAFNAELVSDRVVPILELELGVGWVSPSKHFRISGGYLFNAWYNVMRTSDLVGAVQAGNFNSSLNTITFDGLVIHGEVLF